MCEYLQVFRGTRRLLQVFGIRACVRKCLEVRMRVCKSSGDARVFVRFLGNAHVFAGIKRYTRLFAGV